MSEILISVMLSIVMFIVSSAIMYGAMRMLNHEILFRNLLLLNFIASVAKGAVAIAGLPFIGGVAWFVVTGMLLKKWSSVESFWQVAGIVLLSGVLGFVAIFAISFLLAGMLAPAIAG